MNRRHVLSVCAGMAVVSRIPARPHLTVNRLPTFNRSPGQEHALKLALANSDLHTLQTEYNRWQSARAEQLQLQSFVEGD